MTTRNRIGVWYTICLLLLFVPRIPAALAQEFSSAQTILRLAGNAIGVPEDVSNVQFIYSDADCNGPNGPFRTRVWSSRSGMVRFEQQSSRGNTTAGINASGAWTLGKDSVEEIDESAKVLYQMHELHMIALAPSTRFDRPVYRGRESFNNKPAERLEFQTRVGMPVNLFYDVSTKLPCGMKIVNQEGEIIEVRFLQWKTLEKGITLFTRAEFVQGEYVFSYDFKEITFNNFNESVFEATYSSKR